MSTESSDWTDAESAARCAGVHKNRLYRAARNGVLTTRKRGRALLFNTAEIDLWRKKLEAALKRRDAERGPGGRSLGRESRVLKGARALANARAAADAALEETDDEEPISATEAAELIGVSSEGIRHAASRGDLMAKRGPSGNWTFRRCDVESWARARGLIKLKGTN
jgi:hypothetical protein